MPVSTLTKIPRQVKNRIGQVFSRLTVISFSHTIDGGAVWICRCICGTERGFRVGNLVSGCASSCGCWNREAIRIRKWIHGHKANGMVSTEYTCWINMKQRCEDPKTAGYKNYGGRGISICNRWRNSFPNFLADMGLKPSPKMSIDRINNDGNYEKKNCRWATNSQQKRNTRWSLSDKNIARAIKLRRQGKTLRKIGEILGVSSSSIWKATKDHIGQGKKS